MSCQQLVCAACAGPVIEGRCPTCRASRAEVHQHTWLGVPPPALLLFGALVVLVALLLSQLPR